MPPAPGKGAMARLWAVWFTSFFLPIRSPFTDSMGVGTTGAGAAHRESYN